MTKPRLRYGDWLKQGRATPTSARAVPASAGASGPQASLPGQAAAGTGTEPIGSPRPGQSAATGGPEATARDAAEYLVFRIGRELFALPLHEVEEAVDVEQIQRIPEMSATMLGVLTLRGSSVPAYTASAALGIAAETNAAALIFVTDRGPLALLVDDVDDVLELPPGAVQRPPVEFADTVLTGVARRGSDLVGVLDAASLIAACRAEPALESA